MLPPVHIRKIRWLAANVSCSTKAAIELDSAGRIASETKQILYHLDCPDMSHVGFKASINSLLVGNPDSFCERAGQADTVVNSLQVAAFLHPLRRRHAHIYSYRFVSVRFDSMRKHGTFRA